jgi:hypothetical protein
MADLVKVLVPIEDLRIVGKVSEDRVELTDKLVVGRMVCDSNDTGLLGDALRTPREVAGVQTESTELAVASTSADDVNTCKSKPYKPPFEVYHYQPACW